MNEMMLDILSSTLTFIGLVVALLIALFQDTWRKALRKPKFEISNTFNSWISKDAQKENEKKWYRLKIQNIGKSTSHNTIVKIAKILIRFEGGQEEMSPESFPFPKTLLWGSYEGTYHKNLRPKEFEYLKIFYTKNGSKELYFPLQKSEECVTIDILDICKGRESTSVQFLTDIYSDDLVETQTFIIHFDVCLVAERELEISHLKIQQSI